MGVSRAHVAPGASQIAEVSDAVHGLLRDAWPAAFGTPRVLDDLAQRPPEREAALYAALVQVQQNPTLRTARRPGPSPLVLERDGVRTHFLERPPVHLDLVYLLAAEATHRVDAQRLLGWAVMRIHEAARVLVRPRRFVLPDGAAVDSLGRPWRADAPDVAMAAVSLGRAETGSLSEAIALFGSWRAPFRPFLTVRARTALWGALVEAPTTRVGVGPVLPAPLPGREPPAPASGMRSVP